jgi:hypothetical protein
MIDRIIIDVEGDINRFKDGLINDFTKYKGYKITYTTENKTYIDDGKEVQKQVHLLNIEDAISGKKTRITLIPGNNTIKIIIPGKNEKSLEDKINQFISKTSGFNKIEKTPPIGKPKPGKIKKSKLKEIIKEWILEGLKK